MKHPWSYSTTVRNPERLRDFLRVLKELEGQPFNSENQIKYQILLIKHKLYEPTQLTSEQASYYTEIEKEMPFSVAEEIFNAQNYQDPAMRGRQSVNPLNKMGLSIAKSSSGDVKITNFGKYFLSENYDLGNAFFIYSLKWQLPNLDSESFSADDGFAIKPFVGSLHLINEVNLLWATKGNKPVGMSKEEFSLFAPTLIDYRSIKQQAAKVIEFRETLGEIEDNREKNQFKINFKNQFAQAFLGTNDGDAVTALINNLKDYGDNALRYFRLTRYVYIRGGGFYVDLEPRRKVEIETLLASDNAAPIDFSNPQAYLDYIADISQPVLPWETDMSFKAIVQNTTQDITSYVSDLQNKGLSVPEFSFENFEVFSKEQFKNYIEKLRNYRRTLQEEEIHYNSQDLESIKVYIQNLKNVYEAENRPRELERLANLALNALNDALAIKPNYPVGDDNEPTFTAPGNKPDIECFYKAFNGICEVTMLSDRSQWYNEGQPVMRHIRDFEEAYNDKSTYCLFVAPKLHTDTMETFWVAIKHGYKGSKQNIIPLSLNQFISLLEILLQLKQQGKHFNHLQLLELYKKIVSLTETTSHSDDWLAKIPDAIEVWKQGVLQ